MMTPISRERPDDEMLVDYLLGVLEEDDTSRLDELSIADDEVALRLRTIENDLVDAYVAGELSGTRLDQFETTYLASPVRRQRVEFARALRSRQPGLTTSGGRWSFVPPWALAAAAVLVAAIAIGYLALDNRRLREQMNQALASRTQVETTAQSLQRELDQQRSVHDATSRELERMRAAPAAQRSSPVLAVVLMPLRRGAGDVTTVSLAAGSGHLPLRLRLEGDTFPRYQAIVRAATGEVLWRSAWIAGRTSAPAPEVDIQLPAAGLRTGDYTVEVSGRRQSAEFVASYAFRLVVE